MARLPVRCLFVAREQGNPVLDQSRHPQGSTQHPDPAALYVKRSSSMKKLCAPLGPGESSVSWPASVTGVLSGTSLVLRGAGLAPVWQPRITQCWEAKLEDAKCGVPKDLFHQMCAYRSSATPFTC